jgi:hypothetical protein
MASSVVSRDKLLVAFLERDGVAGLALGQSRQSLAVTMSVSSPRSAEGTIRVTETLLRCSDSISLSNKENACWISRAASDPAWF